jgi:thioesterase domain-containing protein
VSIQPTGSQPPFFCVHPIFGVVFPYYDLARHLGPDQPFYGLQPLGIDGEHLPHTSIADMAGAYIKALRLVQPQGPYFLGGWSFGGLVAFEMAQQLQKANHQVALLALLDTPAPIAANKPSFWDGCKFLLNTAAVSVWPYVIDYFYLIIAPNKQRKTHRLRPMLRVFAASSQAAFNYKPQPYSEQITLFSTAKRFTKAYLDSTMGWSELTKGKVEVHKVPGNHLTILQKPHIQMIARQLNLCLKKHSHL